MTQPVLTGTVSECLRHFGEHRWSKLAGDDRNSVSKIFGVSFATAHVWFAKGQPPIGENLVRLRSFLKLVGYELNDRAKLRPPLDELELLIATRAVLVDDVAVVLSTSRDQILKYLLRGCGISDKRTQTLQRFLTEKASELKQEFSIWGALMDQLGIKYRVFAKEVPDKSLEPKNDNGDRLSEASLLSPEVLLLAQLVNAAAPLAGRLASSEFTPRDRQVLRGLTRVGLTNNVFELSNSLSQLCGERARAQLSAKE